MKKLSILALLLFAPLFARFPKTEIAKSIVQADKLQDKGEFAQAVSAYTRLLKGGMSGDMW